MPRPVDELLAALYESHGPALRRFVQNLTRNAALTEDVVQETMVRAWQRPQVLERDLEQHHERAPVAAQPMDTRSGAGGRAAHSASRSPWRRYRRGLRSRGR